MASKFSLLGKTSEDPGAIPPELRTKFSHEDHKDGGFERIEPITVLRHDCLGIAAEIVRISYWIGHKQDGCTFYQINLVKKPRAFDRDQPNTISVDYNPGNRENSDFARLEEFLKDAEAFIRRLHEEEISRT